MSFHVSPFESDRLQRILKALRNHPSGLTTMLLNQYCDSTRASSDVSEINYWLRWRGEPEIECTYVGTNITGRKVHLYKYVAPSSPLLEPVTHDTLCCHEVKQL